jgi:hypothetical protein
VKGGTQPIDAELTYRIVGVPLHPDQAGGGVGIPQAESARAGGERQEAGAARTDSRRDRRGGRAIARTLANVRCVHRPMARARYEIIF